jgi:hypothetical protein
MRNGGVLVNTLLWVPLCLLAAFGLAEAAGKLICRGERGARCGYYVVPLYGGAEKTEALLRRSVARARRNGGETMLLLDMGADEESLAICGRMARGSGLICCDKERFFDTIRGLDAMR